MKTVYKPWGKEVWLELNSHYCYKRIYINMGYKTSYQYHREKVETNYIIDGRAEVWLENDAGAVEKTIMKAGDFFTVIPPRKHRVVALTDIILQEVSTPQIDDVVRIQDDVGRGHGRIDSEHVRPALCIVAAGKGTRLGKMSEYTNKALLPIDNKAVISNLIESVPKSYEIVMALGYKSNMIREYCLAAHQDRDFIFVEVDKIEGTSTGPGYSLNICKKHLQRPFILSTADCYIKGEIPPIDGDWLGIYPTSIPEIYSTARVDDDMKITSFKNKSKNGYEYAFVGVCSILDYENFWKQLEKNLDSGELVSAFYDISSYKNLKAKHMDWWDVGTIDNYLKAKKEFDQDEKYGISKTNGEFLYKINENFIKIFADSKVAENRIIRAENLKSLIPPLQYKGKNTYSYKWIPGKTLYDYDDTNIWVKFLDWCKVNLWHEESDYDIRHDCKIFYKEKTLARLEKFLSAREDEFDRPHIVNSEKCNTISYYINEIDWDYLCDGIPTKLFHGDLQFDNVIYDNKNFFLIDWRQSFANSTKYGDVYYDLAKLYGGLLISYKMVKDQKNVNLLIAEDKVNFSFKTTKNLEAFQNTYINWVKDNGYNLDKIKKITALIYLNMAPLHEKKFGDALYYQSKFLLKQYYDKQRY
jgi:NDP-sugar pyrophosphorylase family protein/mannose-6-phosphate isomerase-like protein (cupin superfamily)